MMETENRIHINPQKSGWKNSRSSYAQRMIAGRFFHFFFVVKKGEKFTTALPSSGARNTVKKKKWKRVSSISTLTFLSTVNRHVCGCVDGLWTHLKPVSSIVPRNLYGISDPGSRSRDARRNPRGSFSVFYGLPWLTDVSRIPVLLEPHHFFFHSHPHFIFPTPLVKHLDKHGATIKIDTRHI